MFGRTIDIVSNWAVPLEVRFRCSSGLRLAPDRSHEETYCMAMFSSDPDHQTGRRQSGWPSIGLPSVR